MTAAFRTGDVSPAASGARVRLVRKLAGDTQEVFAPKIGMRHKALQAVEGGKAYLRPAYANNIYELYGVDFNFIYRGVFAHLSVKVAGDLLRVAEDQS